MAEKSNAPIDLAQLNSYLTQSAETEIRRLPESVFVATWLPVLAGENIDQAMSDLWTRVAGGPYMPVDVVDDKTGVVIYRVPATYDREAVVVNPERPRGVAGLHHVVLTAKQLESNRPMQAVAYLTNELSKRDITPKISPKLKERVEQLNNIFQRYGKPLIGFNEEGSPVMTTDTGNTSTGLSSSGSELLYD